MQDQQRIFSGSNGRRVILSTNVAETSLTVPGIRYVWWIRASHGLNRYSVKNRCGCRSRKISQASANQRASRCGSTGICVAEAKRISGAQRIHRSEIAHRSGGCDPSLAASGSRVQVPVHRAAVEPSDR